MIYNNYYMLWNFLLIVFTATTQIVFELISAAISTSIIYYYRWYL